MKFVALLALLCAPALASACDGVSVQVNGGHAVGSCFVAAAPVVVQAAPVAVQAHVQTYAVAAPVQVATFQTFAAPVCVQSAGHCGGGVNVQANGGGRHRIFGGSRTSVRVRVRN